MYLLDTNICIYALKGKYPHLTEKLLSVHPDMVKVSAVTVFELEYGAAKSRWGERTRETMHMFPGSFEILPFSDADAVSCGLIRADLAACGTPIGVYDIMIAAHFAVAKYRKYCYNEKQRIKNGKGVPPDIVAAMSGKEWYLDYHTIRINPRYTSLL